MLKCRDLAAHADRARSGVTVRDRTGVPSSVVGCLPISRCARSSRARPIAAVVICVCTAVGCSGPKPFLAGPDRAYINPIYAKHSAVFEADITPVLQGMADLSGRLAALGPGPTAAQLRAAAAPTLTILRSARAQLAALPWMTSMKWYVPDLFAAMDQVAVVLAGPPSDGGHAAHIWYQQIGSASDTMNHKVSALRTVAF
jgi:hypothetical protein